MYKVSPMIALAGFALLLGALYGWGYNLYDLIQGCVNFTASSNWAMLALRAVGVFVFPLGALLGLFF